MWFHVGFLGVIGAFILYLLTESAFRDWINQSFTILGFYSSYFPSKRKILFNFLRGLLMGTKQKFPTLQEPRIILYSLIFYNTIVIWGIVFLKGLKNQVSEREKLFFLYSSTVLFGYLQVLHAYEIFRLQSSSSLGIGLLIFSLDNLSTKFKQWKVVVFYVPIICLVIYLSNTLVFARTSGVRNPWNKDLVFGNQLKEPENIEVLRGKFYDDRTRNYYQTLAKTINAYSCQFEYLVNFTYNSDVPLLSETFKTVQRCPFYDEKLSNAIFRDEQDKIAQLLAKEKAILVAHNTAQIPQNYQIIRELTVPPNIWFIHSITYVAVPSRLSSRCQF